MRARNPNRHACANVGGLSVRALSVIYCVPGLLCAITGFHIDFSSPFGSFRKELVTGFVLKCVCCGDLSWEGWRGECVVFRDLFVEGEPLPMLQLIFTHKVGRPPHPLPLPIPSLGSGGGGQKLLTCTSDVRVP